MHERTRTQCMLHADAATHRTMHTGRCITQAPSLRWLVAFCPCLYLWTMAHRSVCGMTLDMLALKHAHVRAYEHTTHARTRHTKHTHEAHTQSTHTRHTHKAHKQNTQTNTHTHKHTHTHTHTHIQHDIVCVWNSATTS